jgi:hypothetical protein
MDRWGFTDYVDPNKPCVFFGARELSYVIQNHNSMKIVIPGSPNDIANFKVITNRKNLYLISPPHNSIPNDVIYKNLNIEAEFSFTSSAQVIEKNFEIIWQNICF